jgi:hypothetical protein
MDTKPESRSLHLHTLESLCADLISSRPVGVGEPGKTFSLQLLAARATLYWYYRNPGKWKANVSAADAEAIVEAASVEPPVLPAVAGAADATAKRYTLVKVQAHRFAGLHLYGTQQQPPSDFIYEFHSPLTLFEGLNGSGKTSILNAVIWALTGEILRPQRSPESATTEFNCELDAPTQGAAATTHKLTPVTPLPDLSQRPAGAWVPADTWVELTFKDETGALMAPIRRAQTRTAKGKLEEIPPRLKGFGLDPIATRMGTVMPGLLQFIQIGSASELGKAVAELTGMAPLVNLASHAERCKRKIDGEFTKARQLDIENSERAYERARTDLLEQVRLNPTLALPHALPAASADPAIEAALLLTTGHFEKLKADALADAKEVLGEDFDATDDGARSDLEANVAPAIAALRSMSTLPSVSRLASFAKLSSAELDAAAAWIGKALDEARVLGDLAADPSKAGRIRLYARVAEWAKEHPNPKLGDDVCVVCGHALEGAVDPVTGQTVKAHLHDAASADAALLGQTLAKWADAVVGTLSADLPAALQAELRKDLPDHPGALVRKIVVEELFDTTPFEGVLKTLRDAVAKACDAAIAGFPALADSDFPELTGEAPALTRLYQALKRLDRAVRIARWRQDNAAAVGTFWASVVGQAPAEGRPTEPTSLMGRLNRLDAIVRGVEPINQALALAARLTQDLATRRAGEHKLEQYRQTSAGLAECISLGDLAEQQVKQLQSRLQQSAIEWRNRIYQGAFPSTSHELLATQMSSNGELEFLIGARGVTAPAQHVANASALRASLVGFFLAYWNHLLSERGGLRLLMLDDPQELLDADNRDRLADAMRELVNVDAQLVLTTHEVKFAAAVVRGAQAHDVSVDHRQIHPATRSRGTVSTSASIAKVQRLLDVHRDDPDDPDKAQDYASECRVFIEARLGDLFDDAAFPATSATTLAPTLNDHLGRLRGLVKSPPNELFRSSVLSRLCRDSALAAGAPALSLLNKAHHASKRSITPQEVAASRDDLERIRKDAEKVHEEFRLFRRRERLTAAASEIPALEPDAVRRFEVDIQPHLSAFVRGGAVGESQEIELEKISSNWFQEKAFYLLRSSNFGFAGPATSIAIVETIPSNVDDRRLAIARAGENIFARRLLRPSDSEYIALAAETPDPRNSPPTLLFRESDIALHLVVGMLFGSVASPPRAKGEAVRIDGSGLLPQIRTAYRIKEDSAVPLALPDQIALGGPALQPTDFDQHLDAYVALHLSDGSSIFKRVGEKLPAPLSHLRRFESIGGLGVADVLAVGQAQPGIRNVEVAVLILGVLYHG